MERSNTKHCSFRYVSTLEMKKSNCRRREHLRTCVRAQGMTEKHLFCPSFSRKKMTAPAAISTQFALY